MPESAWFASWIASSSLIVLLIAASVVMLAFRMSSTYWNRIEERARQIVDSGLAQVDGELDLDPPIVTADDLSPSLKTEEVVVIPVEEFNSVLSEKEELAAKLERSENLKSRYWKRLRTIQSTGKK